MASKDSTELDFLGVHNNASSPPPQPQGPSRMANSGIRTDGGGAAADTKPLTIFYNGRVAIFHLPNDKAENIMSLVANEEMTMTMENSGVAAAAANAQDELLTKLKGELPIASKRSLKRFFEKRKERLYKS